MVITRRLLLPFAGLLLAAAAPDIEADRTTTTLRWPGLPGALTLPSPTARTLALPTLAQLDVVGIGCSLQSGDASLDLLVLALHDGSLPRVLAIEPLQWQSPGARMNSRPTSGGERAHFAFSRDGALRQSGGQWKRETWTDYLGLKDNRAIDLPVRKPLAGTMQAKLADRRTRALAWLATSRQAITLADLATLGMTPASFDLG
jgi:hypothetical protein